MLRLILTAIVVLLLSLPNAQAQPNISFASKELQEITLRYTGSTMNWPVVVSLAKHDAINNRFIISESDILQLQNLVSVTLDFERQQNKLSDLISTGAILFAKEELVKASTLIEHYLSAVKNGNIELMAEVWLQIEPAVKEVEKSLANNRVVNIRAQLTGKEGKVDRRKGLLSDWTEAFLYDFFEESDGIKTYRNSYASLSFTDGSKVQINPQTEAIIRKSRVDKLSDTSDTEITLIEGGLLTKLSAPGQEKSRYILNAGASTTELKTKDFYAENTGNDKVKLTNYDGVAMVSANDVSIHIGKNEGTIIEGKNAPLPPVKLLPAPVFLSENRDTVINDNNIILAFLGNAEAEHYNIQTSESYTFDRELKNFSTTKHSIILDDLQLGITYIRVQGVDKLGLRGPFSETFRVIRNEDTQPPPIFGDHFSYATIFTLSNRFQLQGITESDAAVKIDNKHVNVSKSGSFSAEVNLHEPDQTVVVTATDKSNNIETKRIRLIRLLPETLSSLTFNGKTVTDDVVSSCEQCTIKGTAYPELEVTLENNRTIRKIKTDSRGRWGAVLDLNEGILSVSYQAVNFSNIIINKEFTVR